MIDRHVRNILPRYLALFLKLFKKLNLHPNTISLMGFSLAVLSAVFIFQELFFIAVLTWWLSRILDGLDGVYARAYDLSSPFGAYLDIVLDMAAYSLVIIVMYFVFPNFSPHFLIILFLYVLCITSALALGDLEKNIPSNNKDNRGLRLASGLAEAGETGIAYSVFLLFPQFLNYTLIIWIVILAVTVISRSIMAYIHLKEPRS